MDLEVTAHKVRWYREQEPKNALRPKLPRLTVLLIRAERVFWVKGRNTIDRARGGKSEWCDFQKMWRQFRLTCSDKGTSR